MYEHPALRRGVPAERGPLCADCGEALGDYGYEAEKDTWVCEECFLDRMEELLRMSPREAADRMDILWRYFG